MMTEKHLPWVKAGMLLQILDKILENEYRKNEITKREHKKRKKILDEYWIRVWDLYPEKNPLVEQAFKHNFL